MSVHTSLLLTVLSSLLWLSQSKRQERIFNVHCVGLFRKFSCIPMRCHAWTGATTMTKLRASRPATKMSVACGGDSAANALLLYFGKRVSRRKRRWRTCICDIE
eukprot:6210864-Pleurochrysis_carterae.AAC.1